MIRDEKFQFGEPEKFWRQFKKEKARNEKFMKNVLCTFVVFVNPISNESKKKLFILWAFSAEIQSFLLQLLFC